MTQTKTHYNETEYRVAIEARYPRLSGWTLLQLEKKLGVYRVRAGTQAIYRANDLQRVLDWLAIAKSENRLILKNTFLVAPEFDSYRQ